MYFINIILESSIYLKSKITVDRHNIKQRQRDSHTGVSLILINMKITKIPGDEYQGSVVWKVINMARKV